MGNDPVFILFVIIAMLVVGFVVMPRSKKKTTAIEDKSQHEQTKDEEFSDHEPFETIRSYAYIHDAAVLRARLEAEGIETFLTNEQTLSANPLLTTAIGGVDLQVRKSQVKRALQIIEEDEEVKGWQEEDEEMEDQ